MSETIEEIYPAPNSFGELPINIERVQVAIAEAPDNVELRFLLGNAYLRTNRPDKALEQYRIALLARPDWAEIRCNVGVAYKLLGRWQEAVSELHQVILAYPELHLAYWQLAQVRLLLADPTGAVQSLERLVVVEPNRIEAWLLLGSSLDSLGRERDAIIAFGRALNIDPLRKEARRYIAVHGFNEGRKLFEAGEAEEAFLLWHSTYLVAGDIFLTDDETVRGFKLLINEFRRSGAGDTALADFQTLAKTASGENMRWTRVVRRILFSQSLIPLLYLEDSRMAEEAGHWQLEFEKGDEPPYARYRLAVVALYQGRCVEAFENLRICADRMPEKKQEGLRIPQLLEIIHRVVRSQGGVMSAKVRRARLLDEEQWKTNGFPSPFQWRSWYGAGFAPEEAKLWREAGLIAERARLWGDSGFTPESAKEWEKVGFTDASVARRWHRAGFLPQDAWRWHEDFSGTFEVAVQCRQVGFHEPKLAEQWMRVFSLPWDAVSWFEVGFTPAEALEWTYSGFSNAYDALSWKQKGVSPQQASLMKVEILPVDTPDSEDEGQQ